MGELSILKSEVAKRDCGAFLMKVPFWNQQLYDWG